MNNITDSTLHNNLSADISIVASDATDDIPFGEALVEDETGKQERRYLSRCVNLRSELGYSKEDAERLARAEFPQSSPSEFQSPSFNTEVAKTHIESLGGSDQEELFMLLDDKAKFKKKNGLRLLPEHSKLVRGKFSEVSKQLEAYNRQGYGIYYTINSTSGQSRNTEDITAIRALPIDIDDKQEVPDFHIPPSFVVETSPGKYQVGWILKQPLPVTAEDKTPRLLKRLIAHYNSDTACSDICRVFRLPGFNHHKGDAFQSKLLVNSGLRYSIEEIMEGIPELGQTSALKSENFTHDEINADLYLPHQEGIEEWVSLKPLISKPIAEFLKGNFELAPKKDDGSTDRSATLTKAYNEIKGWENILPSLRIGALDYMGLLKEVARELGIDNEKFQHVLSTCRTDTAPGIYFNKGEEGVWCSISQVFPLVAQNLIPEKYKHLITKGFDNKKPEANIKTLSLNTKSLNRSYKKRNFTRIATLEEYIKLKDFTADHKVNHSRFSRATIPELNNIIPSENTITFIKSPMGSGKTGFMLEEMKAANSKGRGSFCFAPRVKLCMALVARGEQQCVEITFLKETDSIGNHIIIETDSNYALCAESIQKISRFIDGRDIYIDEIESLVPQLMGGGTVSGARQEACKQLFKKIIATSNRVFCFDANISDNICDLIASFAPDKQIVKIENTYKTALKPTISINNGKATAVIESALKAEKPLIVTDSKKESDALNEMFQTREKAGFCLNADSSLEQWGDLLAKNKVLAKYIYNKYPELKDDSGFLSGNWVEEFLNNPDIFIEKYQPTYFIGTPTMESGVSIMIKGYFSAIYGLFYGVISPIQISQMLFRLRDIECSRYCNIPKIGLSRNQEKGETTEEIAENKKQDLLECLAKYGCIEARFLADKAQSRRDILWDTQGHYLDLFEFTEKDNYLDLACYFLESLNCEITFKDFGETSEGFKEERKITKEIIETNKNTKIFKHEPYGDWDNGKSKEYDELMKINPVVAEEKKTRTIIHKDFPGIEDFSAKVLDNETKEIKEQKIWTVENVARLKDYQLKAKIDRALFIEEVFTPLWGNLNDKVKDLRASKVFGWEFTSDKALTDERWLLVVALKEIGLIQLIQKLRNGEGLTKESAVVQEIIKKIQADKKLSHRLPKISKKESGWEIKYINKLLEFVWLKISREGTNSNNEYYLDKKTITDPVRKAMYECRFTYWMDRLAKEKMIDKDMDWEEVRHGLEYGDSRNLPSSYWELPKPVEPAPYTQEDANYDLGEAWGDSYIQELKESEITLSDEEEVIAIEEGVTFIKNMGYARDDEMILIGEIFIFAQIKHVIMFISQASKEDKIYYEECRKSGN